MSANIARIPVVLAYAFLAVFFGMDARLRQGSAARKNHRPNQRRHTAV